jgi:hypothetical protein
MLLRLFSACRTPSKDSWQSLLRTSCTLQSYRSDTATLNTQQVNLSQEAEFLDEIQTKVLRIFLLVIHSHLYSFALKFLLLQPHATSYNFYKGERRKTC